MPGFAPCSPFATTTMSPARPGTSSSTSTSEPIARQREALEGIFLGRLGGTPELQFPWVWKESRLLEVRPVSIEIDHTPGRGWFRAGGEVTVRVREPVADPEPVTCVIPGHHQKGREVIADQLAVSDGRARVRAQRQVRLRVGLRLLLQDA